MQQEVTYQDTTVMVKSYQPKVEVLWASPEPAIKTVHACSNTQKGPFAEHNDGDYATAKTLIPYLISANHTSVLEHAVISFRLSNISRATLDQVVRHRIASPTASSTHYQNHSNYEHFVDALSFSIPGFVDEIARLVHMYKIAVQRDTQTARQLLPLSVGVVLHWTVNARSLINFLNLRLCNRNTVETIMLAQEVSEACQMWFPECFEGISADCEYDTCRQGKMSCVSADQQRLFANILARTL